MSSSAEIVTYIVDQLAPLNVRTRAMFGEYALYCDEKVVGLICDDTLFLKGGSPLSCGLDAEWLAPPYPGAKNQYAIPGERLDDAGWLREQVQAIADMLPTPKPKKRKA